MMLIMLNVKTKNGKTVKIKQGKTILTIFFLSESS
jgi:hypothetical protein